MKKIMLISFLVLVFPTISFGAQGDLVGVIQGFSCISQGKACPTNCKDPLVATQITFVLVTPDKKLYFIPGVERAYLVRLVGQQVRIMGKIENSALTNVSDIDVNKQGKWMTSYNANSPFNPTKCLSN